MYRRIFVNSKIVDVINQQVYEGWLSVKNGTFEFVEQGEYPGDLEGDLVDLKGRYVFPGLMDTHMHIESSLVTPARFCEVAVQHGTSFILQDPHEVANVFGGDGVWFMTENSRFQPLRICTAIPSCVPATRKPVETPNATIMAEDVYDLSEDELVIALGEVMDYNSVVEGNEEIVDILKAAADVGLSIEGHCPTLKGKNLSTYAGWGIRSDHTLTSPTKMREQLSKGMFVMLQLKSITKENVDFVMGLKDRSRILLVTDDVSPSALLKGHLNTIVNAAIKMGWDPIDAVASATVRAAAYLGIDDLGVIAPGAIGTFFVTDNLDEITPVKVFIEGEDFSHDTVRPTRELEEFTSKIVMRPIKRDNLRLLNEEGSHTYRTNIVSMNQENTATKLTQEELKFDDGFPSIQDKDIVHVHVFRRKQDEPTGNGGLLKGLGLKTGAFASSFSHDTHNIIAVGKDEIQMVSAVNAVLKAGGGMVFVTDNEEIILKLPIGGVITDAPVSEVAATLGKIEKALIRNGVKHKNAIMFLSVLALSVSPYYKFSDLGIVDTEAARIIPLIAEM